MSTESLRGRVILAGGTGLIGRKLATALQEQGTKLSFFLELLVTENLYGMEKLLGNGFPHSRGPMPSLTLPAKLFHRSSQLITSVIFWRAGLRQLRLLHLR